MPTMSFADLMAKKQALGRPLIMGHRGAMGHAPENTLASFKLAHQMGVEAVELDVHLSKDGHLVVHHDETLERTTTGEGEIAGFTLEQLKQLDAGKKFGAEFAGEPIPTLEEVLGWAKGVALPVVIEFKRNPNVRAVVEAAIGLVERMQAGGDVAFISFDHFVPAGVKQARPTWMTGLLYVGRVVDPGGFAASAGADGLLPNFYYVDKEDIERAHAAQKWVGCWAPNSEKELGYAISTGVDMIGTNYPDRLHKLLGG